MKNRAIRVSVLFVFASLLILALTVAVSQPASAQASCPSATGSSGVPVNLRVDIADGTTGKLVVSWKAPGTGSFTYNVCRSTDNSTWLQVNYCSGKTPLYNNSVSITDSRIDCRDDGGLLANYPNGSPLVTSPPTPYYYKVQACNSTGGNCGPFTSTTAVNQNYNTPVVCDCTPTPTNFSSMMPSMQNLPATYDTSEPTTTILAGLDSSPFAGTKDEYFGYHTAGYYPFYPQSTGTEIVNRMTLLVQLPGSGSFCGDGAIQKTARGLGFDSMCVNYDNTAEQENLCAPNTKSFTDAADVANCFSAISQAKLDWTAYVANGKNINCTMPGNKFCGIDPSTGNDYYVANQYDSIKYRISTMLYWLWCNGKDKENATVTTYWETYLLNNGATISPGTTCPGQTYSTAYTPNWSSIILAGWSQGGNMATFADYEYPVQRVINLSAPLPATNVTTNGVTVPVPASYFTDLPQPANFRRIYGLASANDYTKGSNGTIHYAPLPAPPYPASVLQTVWAAMGFVAGTNDDGEVDLNCDTRNANYPNYCGTLPNPLPPLECTSSTRSHNFVNWALANDFATHNPPTAGHGDTLYQWNEDIWEYMLID